MITLIEGLPSGARPSQIVLAARIRRERSRQDKIDLALATANLVLGGFSSTSDTLEAVKHLFTEDEYDQLRQEREERHELAEQQRMLTAMKQYARRFDH